MVTILTSLKQQMKQDTKTKTEIWAVEGKKCSVNSEEDEALWSGETQERRLSVYRY